MQKPNVIKLRLLHLTLWVALIICIGYGFGCEKLSIESARWVLIAGKVVDYSTDSPLDSAWVAVRDSTSRAYSDSTGHFEFSLIEFERIDVFVGKTGYITEHAELLKSDSTLNNLLFKLHSVGGRCPHLPQR